MATSGNHWLRLFDSMDLTQDGEALETPWCGHVFLCKCKAITSDLALSKFLGFSQVPKSTALGLYALPISGGLA